VAQPLDNSFVLLFALSSTFAVPGCGKKDGGPSREEICETYAAKAVECGDPEYVAQLPLIEAYCEYYIAYYSSQYGASCGEAMEDMFACLSNLTCSQIENDQLGLCGGEMAAFEAACEGAGGGDDPPNATSFTETGGVESETGGVDSATGGDTGTTG
jgi:hypothetical protein